MWACVQDQDTTGQWKQVAGWRKVCDLALAHLSRLREYRRGLAEAWPPETNTAARAYIGELDQLIDRVQRTHDAAAANYDALAAAARAIGSARAELQPLHEEYAKKLRQKQAYEATIADPKAVAGSRLPERPPVTDDDLEQLNVRARGLMTGLSGELQHAQVMLRQPPPKPVPKVDDISARPATEVAAPMIPPIIPVPLPATPAVRTNPPRTATQTTPMVPAPSTGPILGGVGSAVNPPSSSPALPSPPTALPSTPSATGGNPVLPPATRPSARPGLPHRNQMQGNSTSGSVSPGGPSRSAPTGGMIGGNIPPAMAQPNSSSPRKVNPVGGVIGGGAAGTTPTGGAGSRPGAGRSAQQINATGLHPLGGSPAAAGSGRFGPLNRASRKPTTEDAWDSDNPWRTSEGVNPVVQAPEDEGPIDPGPAIGLPR